MEAKTFSKTKGDVISKNGYHYAVYIDGLIYDNIHTNGIEYSGWIRYFEIPVGGTVNPVEKTHL